MAWWNDDGEVTVVRFKAHIPRDSFWASNLPEVDRAAIRRVLRAQCVIKDNRNRPIFYELTQVSEADLRIEDLTGIPTHFAFPTGMGVMVWPKPNQWCRIEIDAEVFVEEAILLPTEQEELIRLLEEKNRLLTQLLEERKAS